jgi:5'-methylthioadenosine phosphorylase
MIPGTGTMALVRSDEITVRGCTMIGVFGGSGFYEFLDRPRELNVSTPYGEPAAPLSVGEVSGVATAFLPRHGREHQFPPHMVPYRANVWAMKELGVSCVIGPCAAGSLTRNYEPGHFVICDQLVDRTTRREGTFFDGPETRHLSFAEPYAEPLRRLAVQAMHDAGGVVHSGGTVVVIEGPRFSTRAESRYYTAQGWGLVNMTQAPEVALVRELDMEYVNISVVTDYDAGVVGDFPPVTHEEVLRQFTASRGTLRHGVRRLIEAAAATDGCGSAGAS